MCDYVKEMEKQKNMDDTEYLTGKHEAVEHLHCIVIDPKKKEALFETSNRIADEITEAIEKEKEV